MTRIQAILLAIVLFGLLGLVGADDRKYEDIKRASAVCQGLQGTDQFDQCMTNNLERNGDK